MKPSHQTPKVSVIIATYNYSSVLRYAIATVLWQTFQDFELIVVGDCCTDDSEEVVRSFGDPRVRWSNLKENSGSKGLPLNAGLEIARGELIAYIAHDDLWHPEHLQIIVDAIKSDDGDLAYSVALYVPPPGELERRLSGVFPEEVFSPGNCLIHSTVVHRKSLIDDLGAWPDYRTTQLPPDYVFFDRAAAAGKRLVPVPRLTVWKFNASSRPGCYQEKRCDEQAHYFELLRDDPALAEKELIALARSAMIYGLEPLRMQRPGRDAPPGAYVHHLRQIRGLEKIEPTERLPLFPEGAPFGIELAQPMPKEVDPGQRLELEVRVRNDSDFFLSSEAPYPLHLCYHWLNADSSHAVFDGLRSRFMPPLEPHTTLHYFITVLAPAESGFYRLQPALVQENVRWFDGVARGEFPVVKVGAE